MTKKARQYTTEFKTQAVQLASQPDTSISQVARDLGINDQTLGTWVRNARQAAALDRPAFPGRGTPALSQHEKRIKDLERENAVLRQEREILDIVSKLNCQEITPAAFVNPSSNARPERTTAKAVRNNFPANAINATFEGFPRPFKLA